MTDNLLTCTHAGRMKGDERREQILAAAVSLFATHGFSGTTTKEIAKAAAGLPDRAREVFVLRDVEGLSTAETAASLGVSEDVVKTRLSRARGALRRALLARAGASASEAFRFQRPRCDRIVAHVLARISSSS